MTSILPRSSRTWREGLPYNTHTIHHTLLYVKLYDLLLSHRSFTKFEQFVYYISDLVRTYCECAITGAERVHVRMIVQLTD